MRALFPLLAVLLAACGTTYITEDERVSMDLEVEAAIREFKGSDPGLKSWFDTAAGYAVFPSVGKAAIGVGGAHGRGYVYKKGDLIGYSRLTQATIGLQLGGQAYREVVFFQSDAALNRFTGGNFEFSAQASAVAVEAGASADADYRDGVAVFTMAKGGLMFEASVGGQQFDYEPK